MTRYELAKQAYAKLGVDTDKAIQTLKNVTVSVHCWQGDDVVGFDSKQSLSGGIQTTGNYPGKATTPEELMSDIDKAFNLIPGKKKLNLHASYAIFGEGEAVGRDEIQPKHFAKWVEFAKERGIGLDFNPTFFAHPMVKDNLTLSSPDEGVRKYWVRHGIQCLKIAEYFAEQTGVPCVINYWIPDGYKDVPGDRMGPRKRYMQSMGDLYASIYRSLAVGYAQAVRQMENNLGKTFDKIYIVGGGAKNKFLNTLTEQYTGKTVVALPIEATAIGNLKVQMGR